MISRDHAGTGTKSRHDFSTGTAGPGVYSLPGTPTCRDREAVCWRERSEKIKKQKKSATAGGTLRLSVSHSQSDCHRAKESQISVPMGLEHTTSRLTVERLNLLNHCSTDTVVWKNGLRLMYLNTCFQEARCGANLVLANGNDTDTHHRCVPQKSSCHTPSWPRSSPRWDPATWMSSWPTTATSTSPDGALLASNLRCG